MRVLITGSRNWPDPSIIEHAIHDLTNWYPLDWNESVIVHGDCPTGADAQAESFARLVDIESERHPAQWSILGKKAGPIRNQKMVDLGADVVLAFMMPDSRGTKGCMKSAIEAGLPVVCYYLIQTDNTNPYDDLSVTVYNGAKATAAGKTIKPMKEK